MVGNVTSTISDRQAKQQGDNMQTCASITKTGAPCRAPAVPGGLCFFHAHPEKVQVLGQVGGRKNRQQLPEPPIGPFSATEIRNILAESIFGVRSKTLTPRAASAIAQLCNSTRPSDSMASFDSEIPKRSWLRARRVL